MYNNGGLEQFKVECEAAEQEEPKDEITAHPDNFTRSESKLKKEKKNWMTEIYFCQCHHISDCSSCHRQWKLICFWSEKNRDGLQKSTINQSSKLFLLCRRRETEFWILHICIWELHMCVSTDNQASKSSHLSSALTKTLQSKLRVIPSTEIDVSVQLSLQSTVHPKRGCTVFKHKIRPT